MIGKQKAKTPQPPKGQKQKGQKVPQSAPAGKKSNKQKSLKAAPTKLFHNGQNTPGTGKGTPKVGDKRKLNSTPSKGAAMALSSKPNTPAVKGKNTPAKLPLKSLPGKALTPRDKKTPQAKKTPQVKTPASTGKGGKKITPQTMQEDSEDDDDDDDDDDDMDMGNLEMDSDEDDDLEQDMDDDDEDDDDDDDDDSQDDEEESKASSPKKAVGTIKGITRNQDESEEEDDDDDEDDEDDEDEDDDDDSEDEEAILNKIRALRQASGKQQKQTAANKEKAEKNSKAVKQPPSPSKQPQSPTKQTQSPTKQPQLPTKQKQESVQAQSAAKQKVEEKSEQLQGKVAAGERDKRTLFIKNLPPIVTVQEIKTLSKDIREVRLRITVRAKRREKKKMGYAFLEFASEAVANKNYKALQGSKLGDHDVVVDYVGDKSKNLAAKPKKELADPDPLRLYITGFGGDVKEADLHKLFPKAQEISLPRRKKDKTPIGFAFAVFASEQQCKTSHDKCQGMKLQGHSLVVLYAKKRSSEKQQKAESQKNNTSEKSSQPPAKKARVEDSESDDDGDEEEEDDSEEEDDDDDEVDEEDDDDEDDDEGAEEEDDEDDDDDDDDDDDE